MRIGTAEDLVRAFETWPAGDDEELVVYAFPFVEHNISEGGYLEDLPLDEKERFAGILEISGMPVLDISEDEYHGLVIHSTPYDFAIPFDADSVEFGFEEL